MPEATSLDDPELFVNRELSWLDFNARVLALAADDTLPVLERCKFMAIFSSNLDEFFMVRVAGHQDALEVGRPTSSPDGVDRDTLLGEIAVRATQLVEHQARLWSTQIQPALAREGLGLISLADLDDRARRRLRTTFTSQIFPVLTPLATGPGQPFPYVSGLSLNLAATVSDPSGGETRFARVKLTPGLDRFIPVDGGYVTVEDLVRSELGRLFPGMVITQTALFRLTRDADFNISDEADDLLGAVEAQVRSRRFGDVVRLEIEAGANASVIERLRAHTHVSERDVVRVPSLFDFTSLWQIVGDGPGRLALPTWQPRAHPRLRSEGPADMFAVIRERDLLVHHPFDDFSTSVVRFIDQAVDDPDVVAIKQTIYRTSGDTPIIPALIRAAEAGKSVLCLVELQARFDEERNIRWARDLEQAGVHVVHGQPGRKTHAKLALVMRREGRRLRRYVHIGTGNYHPSTARLYTDLGLFTCNSDITREVHALFNHLTGYSERPRYRKLWVAPVDLRGRIIRQIDRVAAAHAAGTPGRIVLKMNAIIDGPVIQALYRASRIGVPIDLYVRSICGLRPGLPGVSDTIRVTSIVGRFLEHTRLCAFTVGDTTRYWIGSADIMARNLDNRVEVMAPVEDPVAGAELAAIIDAYAADTRLAWHLDVDGHWHHAGRGRVNVHDQLMSQAESR